MEKLYYTIGEVAGILGENVSLVRFWSESFPKFIRPKRNAKGNRMYTEEDLRTLQKVHFLLRNEGLKLEGVARRLQSENASLDNATRILNSLKSMREQLVEIKKGL